MTIIALGLCMISYNLYLVVRIRSAKVYDNPFDIITYLHGHNQRSFQELRRKY
jgi:hypothetical protein